MSRSAVRRPVTTTLPVGPLDQYRRLIESLTDYAIFNLSAGGLIESWNAGANQAFGYSDRDVIGHHYRLIFTPEDRASGVPEAELHAAEVNGKAAIDGWHVRKDGSKFWCTNTVQPFYDDSGKLTGFTKIVRDATQQHDSAEALRESEERLRLLVEGATEYAIFSLDTHGVVTSWNSGAREIFGYRASEIIGKPFSTLYSAASVETGVPAAELLAATKEGRAEDSGWHLRKNGSRFFASGHTALLKPDANGHPRGFVKIALDATMRNDREERIRRKAFNDELTALPNRTSFGEHLDRSIALTQEDSGAHFAVLYLDLDGFKAVNDRFGHGVGDELLVGFARLLERCCRPDDIVSRAGGDEFTVLLTNVKTIEDALSVAGRINVALAKPFLLGDEEVRVSASIGIVLSSPTFRQADIVIRAADQAMYRAKARGGAQHAVFTDGVSAGSFTTHS